MKEGSMNKLSVEYVPVEALKPYERNARKHTDPDVQTIVESIKEFGFDDPIGIWSEENVIVEGHGRLLAAKKLGMKTVPCIRLDHLTDEQRRAYALAHNKTAEMSEWDFDILPEELDNIFDVDMEQFGFQTEPHIEFADFDGLGDGGGSMVATGTKVRIVIGEAMFDIADDDHALYAKTKKLDVSKWKSWIIERLMCE